VVRIVALLVIVLRLRMMSVVACPMVWSVLDIFGVIVMLDESRVLANDI
jgi:hypothetical protein